MSLARFNRLTTTVIPQAARAFSAAGSLKQSPAAPKVSINYIVLQK